MPRLPFSITAGWQLMWFKRLVAQSEQFYLHCLAAKIASTGDTIPSPEGQQSAI